MMKDLLFYFAAFGIFVLSLAGKQDNNLPVPQDQSKGMILADYDFGECFSTIGLSSTQWVIRTQDQFDNLEILNIQSGECLSKPYPEIDFDKYTLLGLMAETGCLGTFERKVQRYPNERKLTYSVTVLEGMPCERLRVDFNWVLVPKLPTGMEVEFNLEQRELPNP